MKRDALPRLAWALTGSGHFLKEPLDIANPDHVERLKGFERVTVVGTVEALHAAVSERIACLNTSSS